MIKSTMPRLLLFLCFMIIGAHSWANGLDEKKNDLPRHGNLEEIGFSKDKIEAARKHMESAGPTIAAVVVVYKGKVLAAWGDTLWDLWVNTRDVDGAAPVLMAEATWTGVPVPVLAPPGVAALVLCLLGAALAVLAWRIKP